MVNINTLNLCSNKGNTNNNHSDVFHTPSDLQKVGKSNQSKYWPECRENDSHFGKIFSDM